MNKTPSYKINQKKLKIMYPLLTLQFHSKVKLVAIKTH